VGAHGKAAWEKRGKVDNIKTLIKFLLIATLPHTLAQCYVFLIEFHLEITLMSFKSGEAEENREE
jgi:hypothetical protein